MTQRNKEDKKWKEFAGFGKQVVGDVPSSFSDTVEVETWFKLNGEEFIKKQKQNLQSELVRGDVYILFEV